jgi:hypothetical protein
VSWVSTSPAIEAGGNHGHVAATVSLNTLYAGSILMNNRQTTYQNPMAHAGADVSQNVLGPDSRMEEETFGSRSRMRQPSDAQNEISRRLWRHHSIDIDRQDGFYGDIREGFRLANAAAWHPVSRSLLYRQRGARDVHAVPNRMQTNSDMNHETLNNFAKHQRYVGSSIQIKHWQLRDLVRCPFERDDVFVVKGFAIYRYNIAKQNVVDKYGFLFEPTCFGFGDSFLGVAGEVSEYAVQGISPSIHSIGSSGSPLHHYGCLHTGGHVNNAIKLTHDLDGRLSAFLCNNSGHLMVMSGVDQDGELTLSETSSIFCPVSINHCAIAEQERTLVYVGDSEEVFVSKATPTGYERCCTFSEASDAGMSCDWNSTGTSFAVASQDGLVCVWDRRQRKSVARLTCHSAARCVKFSPTPLDLLAFTEHRNYLHLVDCRMWENRQLIKVRDDVNHEIDICGFDFSPCGSALYIGTEDSIDILQINSGSRTSFPFTKLA